MTAQPRGSAPAAAAAGRAARPTTNTRCTHYEHEVHCGRKASGLIPHGVAWRRWVFWVGGLAVDMQRGRGQHHPAPKRGRKHNLGAFMPPFGRGV